MLLLLTSCNFVYEGKNTGTIGAPYEANLRYRQALRALEQRNHAEACKQMKLAMLADARRLNADRELAADAELLHLMGRAEALSGIAGNHQADSLAAIATARLRAMSAALPSVSRKTGSVEHHVARHPLFFPALGLSLAALVALLFHYRKVDNYTSALSSSTQEISGLHQRIADIKAKINGYENEIRRLNHRIRHIQSTTNESLGRGQQIFDRVKQGGTMKNISIEDEQRFIDYYAFAHPEQFARITAPFTTLSLRHTTYLILCEMGFGDKAIQEILFVRDSTIRNYRLRMNRNRKNISPAAK